MKIVRVKCEDRHGLPYKCGNIFWTDIGHSLDTDKILFRGWLTIDFYFDKDERKIYGKGRDLEDFMKELYDCGVRDPGVSVNVDFWKDALKKIRSYTGLHNMMYYEPHVKQLIKLYEQLEDSGKKTADFIKNLKYIEVK